MTARSEQGQFASLGSGAVGGSSSVYKEPALEARSDGSGARPIEHGSMQNMLKHIEQLESKLTVKEKALLEAQTKAEKFSARTREGMQSALDTLMQKWMDAVETKDATYKEEFKRGMKGLVDKSAEENGVWQMMVAASALHERQTHDLDTLRLENDGLKQKIDGHYATASSRTEDLLGKRKADVQGDRVTVAADAVDIWGDFAKDVSFF